MSMKTSGWIASAAAAVVVVGGGIWGANALTDEPEVEAAPVVTETPAASAEPVETATVEPEETIEPAPEETVTPEFTEPEQVFLDWARPIYEFNRSDAPRLPEMSDRDMLDALAKACEVTDDFTTDLSVIPGFATADDLNPDNAEDDANNMFLSAARNGDGAGMSYCG